MTQVHEQLYVDGQWRRPAAGESRTVFSPSDEQPVGTAALAAESDVDAAVAAANAALTARGWGDLDGAGRAEVMRRFADELERNAARRAELTSRQNGMPISLANPVEGAGPVGVLRYFAKLAEQHPFEEERPRVNGPGRTIVRRRPVGVVAAVVAWNFPQALTMFKLAPALAAGCTVVLKPSIETMLDTFELAAAAERAGLPPGVLNIVIGEGNIGRYLVAHPGVHKVAFTGSTPVGRAIGATCGDLLRPVTLELGGKSAAIVLDDVDLAELIPSVAMNCFFNNGQTCYLASRLLVPEHRHDEILEAVSALASSLVVGDALDPATQIGPMVSERHRETVESYIEAGKSEGAILAAGGTRPDRDRGWFVAPTVFGAVNNSWRIAQEEIFGPVLSVIPYRTDDEAIAIANDSEYGLGGSVWTTDADRGMAVARRVHTGTIGVNFYGVDYGAPFGGVKHSGIGRELGPDALTSYTEPQSIYLRTA